MAESSRIVSEVDFSKQGKQLGYLRVPHSVHRSAYGWLPYPAASLRNGEGPATLLMSGNHGDEYEGQVILSRLIRELDAADIAGSLMILPMANFPAASAGLRTSPIDDGNLNRSFPGDPDGTPTQMIAHYIESVLLPTRETFLDLHSGGSSLVYLPSLLVTAHPDGSISAPLQGLVEAFDAPYTLTFPQGHEDRMADSAARRKGAQPLATELAGQGAVSPQAVEAGWRGVMRLLHHLGHLRERPPVSDEPSRTEVLEVLPEHYHYAPVGGVFEPLAELGDWVRAGDPAARIHAPETPGQGPVLVQFQSDGMVICKRQPARTLRGDCLFHLAGSRKGSSA